MYLCPLCHQKVESYSHITTHYGFFDDRDMRVPSTVEEFNNRFSLLGFAFEEIKEAETPFDLFQNRI